MNDVSNSSCTKDAQELAKLYISEGTEAFQARYREIVTKKSLKVYEASILMIKTREILINNGIILKRIS